MIQTLRIKNFQRHVDAELAFCAGVNVISGTSDVGKSSIIRALLWLLTNKPSGFDFRNWDSDRGDKVSASMVFDAEGQTYTVVRERSETLNRYVLDGETFVAMKQGVPDEISDLLAVGTVNLQTQYTPHYLLSASAGEVARSINEACDMTIIDTTIRNINAIAVKARSDAKDLESELGGLRTQLEELDWVEPATIRLNQLREQVKLMNESSAKFKTLDDIIYNLQHVDEVESKARQRVGCFDALPGVCKAVQDVDAAQKRAKLLGTLLHTATDIQNRLNRVVVIPQEQLDSVEAACADVQTAKHKYNALNALLKGIQTAQQDCNKAEDRQQAATDELHEMWLGLEVCPLCGSAVRGGM